MLWALQCILEHPSFSSEKQLVRKGCLIFQLIATAVMVHNYDSLYQGMLGIRYLLTACSLFRLTTQSTLPTQSAGQWKSKAWFINPQPSTRLSTVCLQDARPNNPGFFVSGNTRIIYGTSAPISVRPMELLNIARAKPYFQFFYRRDKNHSSAVRLLTLQIR